MYVQQGYAFGHVGLCVYIYMFLYHTSMKYCNLIGPLQVVYFTYTPVKRESSSHISTYTPVIFMTSSKWRQPLDAEQ